MTPTVVLTQVYLKLPNRMYKHTQHCHYNTICGLSARSEYFYNALVNKKRNVVQNKLSVVDFEPSDFELVVHYIYTAQDCFRTVHECCVGLYAGDRFGMADIKSKCSRRLCNHMRNDSSTAPLIVRFIDRFDSRDKNLFIYDEANDIIRRNYQSIINSETVKTYERETMEQLLEMSIEGDVPEIDVFRALIKWATSECIRMERDTVPEEVRQVCGDMLRLVRFPLIAVAELSTEVMESGLLSLEHMALLLGRAYNPSIEVPFIMEKRQSAAPNRQVITITIGSLHSQTGRLTMLFTFPMCCT